MVAPPQHRSASSRAQALAAEPGRWRIVPVDPRRLAGAVGENNGSLSSKWSRHEPRSQSPSGEARLVCTTSNVREEAPSALAIIPIEAALRQAELTGLMTCSLTSHDLRTCSTPRSAPHLLTSRSKATEKPGPF